MRTVPRSVRTKLPGDHVTDCFYCGDTYLRSRMRRDAGGNLRCTDCQQGSEACDLDPLERPTLSGLVVYKPRDWEP